MTPADLWQEPAAEIVTLAFMEARFPADDMDEVLDGDPADVEDR